MEIITTILQGITSLAGVVIAALAIRLSRQQTRDSWLRTYKELHETFWSDPDFREIRAWLASDAAYAKVQPVLKKRQSLDRVPIDSALMSEDEYRVLEKLDRFLNFMMRVVAINPEFKKQKDLWEKLYFNYWLLQFSMPSRSELAWYLGKFYEELDSMLRGTLAEQENNQVGKVAE